MRLRSHFHYLTSLTAATTRGRQTCGGWPHVSRPRYSCVDIASLVWERRSLNAAWYNRWESCRCKKNINYSLLIKAVVFISRSVLIKNEVLSLRYYQCGQTILTSSVPLSVSIPIGHRHFCQKRKKNKIKKYFLVYCIFVIKVGTYIIVGNMSS